MGNATLAQIVVTALLSSGMVGGVLALITKSMWSPESKNELARLGNEFAQQLLQDAKVEREELRITIRDLEHSLSTKREIIERLNQLAEDKDIVIRNLEERQIKMAEKLKKGLPITLQDIFGGNAPAKYKLGYDEVV